MMINVNSIICILLVFCVGTSSTQQIVERGCDPNACPPLDLSLGSQLQPGESIGVENADCCPEAKIICDTNQCPTEVEFCDEARTIPALVVPGRCCNQYDCNFANRQCVMDLNGERLRKNVGEKWNDNITCTEFECLVDQSGELFINSFDFVCPSSCQEGFELRVVEGQCCSGCVQTRCTANGQLYEPGDTWTSSDNCNINECVRQNNQLTVNSTKRICPPLGNCPLENVVVENCCPVCRRNTRTENSWMTSDNEITGVSYIDENTYENHPCSRKCLKGEKPMKCYYKFAVEWYETLSKACYDCPYNQTDCSRPHCITGDGVKRSVLVVNRMMPGPTIDVCLDDIIMVDVTNHLLGESTTLHWHGLHQKNTPYMDGVPHISQCPIAPGGTFRYTFKADNAGTHFWHSHTGMQRGDGSFGALIIRKPEDRYEGLYDEDLKEHILTLNDWGHMSGVSMFTAHHHSDGDNKPPNILINGKGKYFQRFAKVDIPNTRVGRQNVDAPMKVSLLENVSQNQDAAQNVSDTNSEAILQRTKRQSRTVNFNAVVKPESRLIPLEVFRVDRNKRYRFRVINAEFLNCPMEISIEGHNLTVISSDGYDIRPIEVGSLVTYAGERFDFILNTNKQVANYWVRVRGLMDCDERFTSAYQMAVLRYNGAAEEEPFEFPPYDFQTAGVQLNALNRGTGLQDTVSIAETTSADQDDYFLLKNETDYKFYIYYDFYGKDNPHFHVPNLYGFHQIQNKTKRLFTPQLNHISMKMPKLPLMPAKDKIDDSHFCNESSLAAQGINCRETFCECSHVLHVPLHSTVELVLIDEGFTFDANHPFHLHGHAFRVVGMERLGNNVTMEEVQSLDAAGRIPRRLKGAPVKDTVTIPDGGYTIIRFIANNPGYWLFHCHIEFHAEIGMALVFKIGETHEMKSAPDHFPTCYDYQPDYTEGSSTANKINTITLIFIILTVILFQ